jgi:hypothetical protein
METYKRRLSQSSGCCFIQFSACKTVLNIYPVSDYHWPC